MPITQNPTIDLAERDVFLFYLTGGAAVFGCIGDPENVVLANKRSLALSDDGNVYFKTTDNINTGWVAIGGVGGSGTVTNFTAGDLSPLFTASVANPTTTPALTFAQVSQLQNLFFASPNGAPGNPSFRAIATADLSGVALASPPNASVQFNNGTNGFLGDSDFIWDTASGTLQLGLAGARVGKLDIRGAVSGSVRLTVDQPSASPITYQFGNSLPATNDLWRAANVTGNTVTLGFVAPGSLGFPSINPTDGVIPYRSSSSALADSPLLRLSSTAIGFSSASTGAALSQTVQGGGGMGAQWLANGRGSSPVTGNGFVASDIYVNQFTNNGSSMRVGIRYDVGVFLGSTMSLAWTNAADNGTSPTRDAGIERRTAGVLRITNGSTGLGQLLLGNSSATAIGQVHIINSAVGIEPLYLEAIASTSVPVIRGVQSGIQSFALNPSGKIVGGANIPTTNQQFSAIGNLKSDVSTIGNVGTGTDNLLSFVIQANVLNNTGDYAEFDAFGEFENNANNKRLAIVFGATTIFNTGAVAFGSTALVNWRTNTKIIRTGSASQKVITTFWSNDSSTPFLQEIFLSGEDLTINRTVQFQAEATANDDVVQYHLESKLCVAQTS